MKRFLSVLMLCAGVAWAGETYIGTLTPTPGVSHSNLGAGGDAGFLVKQNALLTTQCLNPDGGSAATYVCTDVSTCTAGIGILLTGTQIMTTSVATSLGTRACANPDAGTMDCPTSPRQSAKVSVFTAQSDVCTWWTRTGAE